MRHALTLPARLVASLLLLLVLWVPPAVAQSLLRDAETETLFADMARPLLEAASLDPRAVHVGLVGDPSINAFAMLGQQIYFHSGLLVAAGDVLEVQGVLAHEIGHVAGGHAVRFNEGIAPASNISILSLVLAGALIASGAGDAGMAALMAGQQAAQGKFLAFSREQESRTDQAGARFLEAAGVDGRGMISFFRKLQGDEFRLAIPQDNPYNRTHPLTGERISALQNVLERSPHWGRGADEALRRRYRRVRGKHIGFISEPADTFRAYPPTDTSPPARVARAYAFHKRAEPDKALAELDALLAVSARDPYIHEMRGQILLESGRVRDALPDLRLATAYSGDHPLISAMLGHALVLEGERDGNPALHAEAEAVLRGSIARDRQNPFAWLQLGTLYERRGDAPRAALATAERLSLTGGDQRAIINAARTAAAGLPKGSPDRLRAEDLVLAAQAEYERTGKKRGRG